LVVVDDARSAEALLGWSLHQAGRRHSHIEVCYVPAFPYEGQGWIVDPETVGQGRKELTATLDRLGAGSRVALALGALEESTTEAVRARALDDPQGLLMVGPLAANTLVRLVFRSDPHGVDAGPALPLVVVPGSAWTSVPPCSTPSWVTVGFHGSDPAAEALAWAVAEANRRGGLVRAVMAWCEGDYGGLGGPVPVRARHAGLVARSAQKLADESLSRCGVPTDRVRAVARRGMPASLLIEEAVGSDLLVISAGRSTVFGYPTLGPITLACLARSPVPVVIVPGQADGGGARSCAHAEATLH
jgi:nucleotide-binding universal stress UspA family protein